MPGKVLVLDSDTSVAGLHVDLLTRNGFQAQSCFSPERAIVQIDQDPFDLVLLDVDLPEKKGPKVAWAIREKGHQMPIVGLVNHDGSWDSDDLKDLGFNLLLNKPVDGPALLLAVRNLIVPRTREAAGGAGASA